ncbi:helix-turn-helix transcriptional regulator [Ferrimonas balearica]|uniref:helix-turn-helix transcriptional regulator n=1 Tax=Ferrimonas balearica TaxID=44012 RepID=UPI001C99BC00|nr:hypothetical protein [Ferrimonas balearica]MBY5920953.1 hypothetical protein [Ferrimonas balearica]MBY5996362.1 hypothetical protein [Ferrimonas balearica]
MTDMKPTARLLSRQEVLDMIGVTDSTMRRWQMLYGFPRVSLGSRFSRKAVEDWLAKADAGTVVTTKGRD